MCEYGRDSSESWGKRRRRSLESNSTEEKAEDMTLSQEILVLDFGDEKQSQFLKNDASIDFNEAGTYSRFNFQFHRYIAMERGLYNRVSTEKYINRLALIIIFDSVICTRLGENSRYRRWCIFNEKSFYSEIDLVNRAASAISWKMRYLFVTYSWAGVKFKFPLQFPM